MALITIPVRDYAVGNHPVGPVSIAAGITKVKVLLSRAEWKDPAVVAAGRFELSLDGGLTWSPDPSGELVWPWGQFPVRFTARGDPVAPNAGFAVALPAPENSQRQIRGVVSVSGGTLRTAITVETT